MFFPEKTNIRIRFLYPNTKRITASGENMNNLKQESHHSSIFNCHKQEEKEESTTTIVVLLTTANGDGINVRSKRHNLQHE